MLLALAFYGSLAALALWSTWVDEDLRWIGVWLAGGFVASNTMFFLMPITSRPGPYSFIEMMVALAAFCAWGVHGQKSRAIGYALIGIVVANIVSICANIAFAANYPPTWRQIYFFEVTTNLCFAVECLTAIGVGIAHGRRTGRFDRWIGLRRAAAQPNAAREAEQ